MASFYTLFSWHHAHIVPSESGAQNGKICYAHRIRYIAVTRCCTLEQQNKVMRRFHKVLTGTRAGYRGPTATNLHLWYPLSYLAPKCRVQGRNFSIRLRNFRPRPFEGNMTIVLRASSSVMNLASAVFTLHSISSCPNTPRDCGDMLVLDKLNYFIWKWTITNKISQAIYAV